MYVCMQACMCVCVCVCEPAWECIYVFECTTVSVT